MVSCSPWPGRPERRGGQQSGNLRVAHAERAGGERGGRHSPSCSTTPAGLAMAFKLIEAAQDRWRAVNAPHLVALVRAGATFINGELVERPDEPPQSEAA
jgi:hypothetical protein